MKADASHGRSVLFRFAHRVRSVRNVVALALVLTIGIPVTGAGAIAAVAGLLALTAVAVFAPGPRGMRRPRERGIKDPFVWRSGGEAVTEAFDQPAFLLAADGMILHANAAAVDRFGAVGESMHLSSRIRSPGVLDMVREAIDAGTGNVIEHCERVPSERWYNVRIAPVRPAAGTVRHDPMFLLTFTDVTEARRMNRMRSDFVANASHELRTPLASLTGFIETLQGPAREDAAARERFLSVMLDQAERMSRLVDDLMSLSRLELRAHVAPSERVDLDELVAHVCDTLRPLAGELGVTIRYRTSVTPAIVAGDRDELIQVFQNLIENACKYGQPGKYVDVAIERPGGDRETSDGMLDVTVRDYGPGIAPEHVPRLTERFYRVNAESSRSKKGTGLGLAIVKHILTRHRGRLLIRSRPDEGSVFVARFEAA